MPAEAFLPIDRWQLTAAGPASQRGDPLTLTWSIVPDGTPMPGGGSSRFVEVLDASFGAGSGGEDLELRPWFPLVASSFGRWSDLGGLRLRYEPYDDGAMHRDSLGVLGVRGDIRLAANSIDGIGGVAASSQYPDSGDVSLDVADFWRLGNPAGNYRALRNTMMHEIGHTLGLDHIASDDAAILMEPQLQLDFDGPQIDDIRGLHYLYGDRFETAAGGNDTPATATPLGELRSGTQLTVGGDGAFGVIRPEHVDLVSIDSRVDRDYYSFEVAFPGWLDLSLQPLGGTYLQGEVGAPQFFISAGAGNNLDLAIYGPESFQALAPARRAGEVESLEGLYLPLSGRYVVEVTGSRDTVQLYQLELGYSRAISEPLYAIAMIFIVPLLKLNRRLAIS